MAKACRDCSKCTERGVATGAKKSANLVLIVCTFGLSAIISGIFGMFRKKCPICGHPMKWHARVGGRFVD